MSASNSILQRFWDKMRAPAPPGADAPRRAASDGATEFVVVGLGRFGASVARTLTRMGHTVLALDNNEEIVQSLATVLPNVVALDATNIDALRQAGADGFDAAVICTGSFEANILATVHLRRLGLARLIAKAQTLTERDVLLQVGADEVILPEYEAGLRLGRRLANANVVDFLEMADDVSVVEVIAPPNAWGRTLAEVDVRGRFGLTVIAVRRGEAVHVSPPNDFVFQENDIAVMVGKLEDAERFKD
jgi:trk system potassium uptake protein TrkA